MPLLVIISLLLLSCFAFPGTSYSLEGVSESSWGRGIVGDINAAPGTAKDYGKGRCSLCHAFKKTIKSHYFIGPNLEGVTTRANERLKDPRYHRGHPKARKTVIKESYPGAGTASTALEYLAESLLCASCYVVPGYGVPGTHDKTSPEIDVTQPPHNLRLNDLVAVIQWLYTNDGKTPPARDQIEAALFKFVTPLERVRLQAKFEPPPPQERVVLAVGTESVNELFGRPQCIVCHVIPGVAEASGSIGPPLKMRPVVEQRLKDPAYQGSAKTPREYVIESILEPHRYVPPDYPGDVMPTVYNAKLTPLALDRMADYLLGSDEEQAAMRATQREPSPHSPFFPPYQLAPVLGLHDGYASMYAKLLTAAGEEPLLGTVKPDQEILRFVWYRTQHPKVVIRVDVGKGEVYVTAKEISGWGTEKEPFQVVRTEQKSLPTKEWQSLKKLFDKARFWDLAYHERTVLDGAGWLTERIQGTRYHVTHMWSPETGLYRAACLSLLKLSNLPLDPIY